MQASQIGPGRRCIAALRHNRLLQGLHVGVLRSELRLVLIGVLLRGDPSLGEDLQSLGCDARELAVRFPLLEARLCLLRRRLSLFNRSLRLMNLLVQFWRVDFRHHLAHPHVIADIHETPPQVAIGAGENRSLCHGLHRPRQLDLIPVRKPPHSHHL